ncbi:MAG: hypothetical protein H7222_11460 [Methylotenera sp.]|nr:hypothetical protein [Oligoflexia bacterium]
MALLPAEMRSNHVLMYASKSSQFASELFPRVILFDEGAKNIISFVGDPSHPSYSTVEIMQRGEPGSEYSFKRIELKDEEGNAALNFHDNPQECRGCHHCKPNWDSYPLWPGAYGGARYRGPHGRDEPEFKKFLEFMEQNGKRGIYAHLDGLNTTDTRHTTEINGDFSLALGQWNSERIFKEVVELIKENPMYEAAIVAAFSGSWDSPAVGNGISDFLPKVGNRAKTSKDLKALAQQTYTDIHKSFMLNQERYVKLVGKAYPVALHDVEYTYQVAQIRFVIEGILGHSTANWSLSFKPGTYLFSDGLRGMPAEVAPKLYEYLQRKYPDLAGGFKVDHNEVYVSSRGMKFPDAEVSYDVVLPTGEKGYKSQMLKLLKKKACASLLHE